jgi:hypothetical protein
VGGGRGEKPRSGRSWSNPGEVPRPATTQISAFSELRSSTAEQARVLTHDSAERLVTLREAINGG